MRVTIKLKLGLAFGARVAMASVMATLANINLSALNADITTRVTGPVASAKDAGDTATTIFALDDLTSGGPDAGIKAYA